MHETLQCSIVEPKWPATASVIWLHGLGASGDDFIPIVPQLGLTDNLAVRFVFPHAPSQAVTLNGGFVMPAWFDILALSEGAPIDAKGVETAKKTIHSLIDDEIKKGVPSERIILIGFSQGGSLALFAGLSCVNQLGGLIALSCFLPKDEVLISEMTPINKTTPILQIHGQFDALIVEEWGQRSCDFLQEQGYQVTWHSLAIEHNVSAEEAGIIGQWITERLSK